MLVAGLALIGLAQFVAPVAAPLFDGLTVLGPYRYLAPVGTQAGAPTSATVTKPVVDGASPGFSAATTETPPQAQLIAIPGAFQLGPGTTAVTVTIEPIAAPAASSVGTILGNVYHYSVTDQAGAALSTTPGTDVTIVLRAPDATSVAVVAQYAGGQWTQITSSPAGTPAFFIGTIATFGDFTLVAAAGGGIGPVQVVLVALPIAVIALVVAFLLLRRRRRVRPFPRPPTRRDPATTAANRKKGKRR